MSYAFTLDASACSGCKACQEACKDKNQLPAGMLWRRVIEVTGGDWRSTGAAWENNIFAYHLSLACNHCTHPKCAGVCPTDAYHVRPDGIVLIETEKCMGCGYCAWACPYGAPRYDAAHGVMTKCNFCYDDIEAGLPPSCVAACPLRVLNYGTIEDYPAEAGEQKLWQLPGSEHPFPLPNFSRTEPHLAIKLHAGMSVPAVKVVANREEIIPPRAHENVGRIAGRHELPLVAFTLLTQMAAGMAIISLLLAAPSLPLLLTIGCLFAAGGLISFLHLGRKRNAWRGVVHIRKSWLSREILMVGIFGAAWLVTAGSYFAHGALSRPWLMAISGAGLVYSMANVYRLRAVPGWNTWRTHASFTLSMLTLGSLGVMLFVPDPFLGYLVSLLLLAEWGMILEEKHRVSVAASLARFIFIGLGLIGMILSAIFPQDVGSSLVMPVLVIVVVAEVLGRWQFYAQRVSFPV